MSPFGFLKKGQREAEEREKVEMIRYRSEAFRSFREEDQCKTAKDHV